MEAPLPPPVALREDNVPDDLICSICMTVPTEPLLTPCDHLFCRTCIRQALGNQNLCPIDRQPCSPHQLRPLDGLISRVWGGIQVKCGCHESGCVWTGSIADYSAHLESCSVYSNSNSALRREIARLKEQLEEKDEENTSLQTRLNEALRNNERNEYRYRSTLDELNAMREKLNAAERRMRRVTESLQDADDTMGAGVSVGGVDGVTWAVTMDEIKRLGCKFLVKKCSVFGNIAVTDVMLLTKSCCYTPFF